MTILKDKGLTKSPFDDLVRQSFPGMAHFAGTGPSGLSCSQCALFERKGDKMEAPCQKYKQLTGRLGKSVPAQAMACRHFEPKAGKP